MATPTDPRYTANDGPRDRSLRVGDKDRDAVGEMLRQRHLEGRLDTSEFEARLERCMAAKTYAQLDELIADFPPERERAQRSQARTRWGRSPLFLLLPAVLIAAVVSGGHLAWLAFPLVFFVLRPLMWRSWGGGYWRAGRACRPRSTTRA
jgi:uncharacterized protein DUF1707